MIAGCEKKESPRSSTQARPPIDCEVPRELETATFALG
jgi:hypothetical protein